jgi:hypothetical protein
MPQAGRLAGAQWLEGRWDSFTRRQSGTALTLPRAHQTGPRRTLLGRGTASRVALTARSRKSFTPTPGPCGVPVGPRHGPSGPNCAAPLFLAWHGSRIPQRSRVLLPSCLRDAIVLCESAIDAISCHALHPDYRCLSTSGARPDPAWLGALLAQGHPIYCGFDADPTGDAMAQRMRDLHPFIRRLRPPAKDWNDLLRQLTR